MPNILRCNRYIIQPASVPAADVSRPAGLLVWMYCQQATLRMKSKLLKKPFASHTFLLHVKGADSAGEMAIFTKSTGDRRRSTLPSTILALKTGCAGDCR